MFSTIFSTCYNSVIPIVFIGFLQIIRAYYYYYIYKYNYYIIYNRKLIVQNSESKVFVLYYSIYVFNDYNLFISN